MAGEPRAIIEGQPVLVVVAHQHDYFCRVVEDTVAGSSTAAHEAALNAMEYLQTGARRSAAEVMAAFAAS